MHSSGAPAKISEDMWTEQGHKHIFMLRSLTFFRPNTVDIGQEMGYIVHSGSPLTKTSIFFLHFLLLCIEFRITVKIWSFCSLEYRLQGCANQCNPFKFYVSYISAFPPAVIALKSGISEEKSIHSTHGVVLA